MKIVQLAHEPPPRLLPQHQVGILHLVVVHASCTHALSSPRAAVVKQHRRHAVLKKRRHQHSVSLLPNTCNAHGPAALLLGLLNKAHIGVARAADDGEDDGVSYVASVDSASACCVFDSSVGQYELEKDTYRPQTSQNPQLNQTHPSRYPPQRQRNRRTSPECRRQRSGRWSMLRSRRRRTARRET